MLAWYLAPGGHRGLLAGASLVGLVLAAAVAAVLVRWPWVLPFLVLAACRRACTSTSAREPTRSCCCRSTSSSPRPRSHCSGSCRSRTCGHASWARSRCRWRCSWPGAASLTLWADDRRRAAVVLLCFVLPFGLLAVALARLPWSREGVAALWVQLALMGVVFALVGIVQWLTRDAVWAPARLSPGAYVGVHRVDSVFLAAAPYARFLVVAILASVAVALARPAPRTAAVVAFAILVTWVGLYFAHSARRSRRSSSAR